MTAKSASQVGTLLALAERASLFTLTRKSLDATNTRVRSRRPGRGSRCRSRRPRVAGEYVVLT